ncbi:MAG: hypothetical protein J5J06_19460 [Phycisphaerae bacterium]|nr:hypothetical protein [Phycisphaerae bacterium]
MSRVQFSNRTDLDDARLRGLCMDALAGWAVGHVDIRIRYSRGADFSGKCYYLDHRILVNLGRHLKYPYRLRTHIAKARTVGRSWFRPLYSVELMDGYEVILFVFLHELYHLLVKRARRNPRQKEGMCDRFAVRYLADRFGAAVRNEKGEPIPREAWDVQDVEGFVAAARDRRVKRTAARRPVSGNLVTGGGDPPAEKQGWLFR